MLASIAAMDQVYASIGRRPGLPAAGDQRYRPPRRGQRDRRSQWLPRAEQGRFACLRRAAHGPVLGLSAAELQLFLEGCALVGKLPLSPPALSAEALRIDAVTGR